MRLESTACGSSSPLLADQVAPASSDRQGRPQEARHRRRPRSRASAEPDRGSEEAPISDPIGRTPLLTTMYAPDTRDRRCGTSAAKIEAALMSRIITPSPLPNSARKSIASTSGFGPSASGTSTSGAGTGWPSTYVGPIPSLRPSS